MIYKGRIHKFGDDINTDEIIPARYLNTTDKAELAGHCMEDADKDFPKNVKAGDIIVAGKNFGCGSSREHAPIAIKAAGVSCVIAENFARIFFRNSINIGLPIIESKEASRNLKTGDQVSIDPSLGVIRNLKTKAVYKIQKYPAFMQRIVSAGGLMGAVRKDLKTDNRRKGKR